MISGLSLEMEVTAMLQKFHDVGTSSVYSFTLQFLEQHQQLGLVLWYNKEKLRDLVVGAKEIV